MARSAKNLSIERTDPLPGPVSEAMTTRGDDREGQDAEDERWIAAVRRALRSPSLRVRLGRAHAHPQRGRYLPGQALMAASGQALVDRYTAVLEGLLTNEGAKLHGTWSNASGGAGSFGLIKEGGRQVIFLPLPHEVFSFARAAAPSGLVLGWFLHTAPGWQWYRHRYDAADHPAQLGFLLVWRGAA